MKLLKPMAAVAAFAALCMVATTSHAKIPHSPPSSPPAAKIVSPESGQTFLFGDTIAIHVQTLNFTDAVASVEFFAGTNSLGVVSNYTGVYGFEPLQRQHFDYSTFIWTNAPVGEYALSAIASDVNGNSATSAPVDISVVTNIPPVVSLLKPRDGSVILGPTNITLYASAFDPGGSVAQVEFFEGTNSLGVVTNPPITWITNWLGVFPIHQTSYSLVWSNVAVGNYILTAVATDNAGVSSTSSPAFISVVSNLPPVVKIFSPENGANFLAPANINIWALASATDGNVASVEFFAGSQSLGLVTNALSVTNWGGNGVLNWYHLDWSPVAMGSYALTAVVTDGTGLSSTSAPVNVTVSAPPPPQVRIVWPRNGSEFAAPANVHISAVTELFPNPIAQIQFWSGTNSLGTVTNTSWPTSLTWTNVPVGTYSLTASATDTGGITATSPPVSISVVTNAPPPWFGH